MSLHDDLRNVNRELKELAKTAKDLHGIEKEVAQSKREELVEQRQNLESRIARNAALGGIGRAALQGLADPFMSSRELTSQTSEAGGRALGGVSILGFQLGEEAGGALGGNAADVVETVLTAVGAPPAARNVPAKVMGAVQESIVGDVAQAKRRRQWLEAQTADVTGMFGSMGAQGYDASPEQVEAVMDARLRMASREFEARKAAIDAMSRSYDKLGVSPKSD